MLTIDLDPIREQRLRQLAQSQGEEVALVAGQILADYVDLLALPEDDEASWAAASVALTAEILDDEDWSEESSDESR